MMDDPIGDIMLAAIITSRARGATLLTHGRDRDRL